jgi:quercetin dioxygenase-like cupin family protein
MVGVFGAGVALGVLAVLAVGHVGLVGPARAGSDVAERALLDNDRVTVMEYTFPAGFKGDEHAAIADEFAYVLDGELGVVTKGQGKRVLRKGELEYAAKGTMHYSLNESKRPARVLVVLLKEC